jgi:hypothetical protein
MHSATDRILRQETSRAAALLRRRPAVRLVAAAGIGVLGYHSRLPMLDLVGIVDPKIARSASEPPPGSLLMPGHQRFDVEYVLARRPDVIVVRRPRPDPLPAEAALWGHPEFETHYAWDPRIPAYVRRREPSRAEAGPAAAEGALPRPGAGTR